jgi:hypothetical protein
LLAEAELQIEVEEPERAVQELQLVILSLLQEFLYLLGQEAQETDHILGAMAQVMVLLLELHHQFHVQVEEEVETDLTHQVKIVFQEKMVIQEDQAEELLEDLEERQLHQVVAELLTKEIMVDKELKTGADTLEAEAVIILLHLTAEELPVMD